ncbi:MAG: exopolysaccharide biosynthesis polyprenyl glycosylphosphotransferase [Candidatus Eremiobacteraeota bacterium]|nr:exopolysaccharide biosynthesis polyprenyl glycosylphosphotransferase [Candidatus Eremiobacteraeota bacterium]MBC5803683.1 exopolysaccharide biosynthesis polyprenyl glycosylphosphotransferase [Candidatus Eremiobacteraeota bacterium]MBC5821482.1 exopolysaccharide biosynthesis polyprenyl glycosylphosphotransferase [Candidatus Eremiobacteraeota bacterium]
MTTTSQTGLDTSLGTAAQLTPRPQPARFGRYWGLVLFVSDLIVTYVAALLAATFTRTPLALLAREEGTLQAVVFGVLLWIMLFERIGMYRRSFAVNARDEVYAALAASTMGVLPTLAIFLLLPSLLPYRHLLVGTTFLAVVFVSATRFMAYAAKARVAPARGRRIAVVGTPERVAAVPQDLSLTKADNVVRLGIDDFDDEVASSGGDVTKLDWLEFALEHGCTELIVTEALPPEIMPALLRTTEARGLRLAFAPMRIRPHACDFQVRRDGGLALLYPQSLAICTPGAELLRRTIDLGIALPALLLLSPLMAAIAAGVALDLGAPIFYLQTRVGKLGRPFRMIKFRTMPLDAEATTGPIWARAGEPRVSRYGRFLRRMSLDELPQLFNVVRGDMSIVGPRPERPFYVEQFRKMLPRYDERHLVRPGVTGWSHIHMHRNVDTSAIGERLSYDLFYLEHWSVFMDIFIVCKTAFEFLFHSAV